MLRLGLLELPHHFAKPWLTLAALEQGLAALRDVDLVVLSEGALTGFVSPRGDFDLRPLAEPLGGGEGSVTLDRVEALARQHHVSIATSFTERDGDRFFNSYAVIDEGGARLAHWRKRHPWHPETFVTPGDLGTPTVTLRGHTLTAGVCYDVHFLSDDAGPALDRSEVLLFPSAWCDEGPEDLRAEILPALARRHHVWIVNPNWGRGAPRTPGQGSSRIVSPRGEEVARTPDRPGVHALRWTFR